MLGNMPIEIEGRKKEILENFGKPKLTLPAARPIFLIINLSMD